MQISLLSDFGLHDPSVAVTKGVLMQYTTIQPIDISHEVKPFYAPQAAYLFSAAYPHFSAGACHLLLFDIFSEERPRLILSAHKGHYFLSPDNGLLLAALGAMPENSWLCFEADKHHSFIDWLHEAGKIIWQLEASGRPQALPAFTLKEGLKPAPVTYAGAIPCQALHIDRYENVALNFTKQQYDECIQGRRFRLQFTQSEEISEVSSHYNSVKEGYKLCRFNSNGCLEISINKGRAASLFGIKLAGRQNDIKIIFE